MKKTSTAAFVGVLALIGAMVAATPAAAAPSQAERATIRAIGLNAQVLNGTLSVSQIGAADLAKLREMGVVSYFRTETTTTTVSNSDAIVASAAARLSASSKAAVVCKTKKHSRTAYALAGNALYSHYHVGGYCTNGSTVVSASWQDGGGQSHWLGWSNLGLVNKGAGVVSGQGRSYSQQSFQYQLLTPYPTQYVQPCLRVRALSNLVVSLDSGCGIY